MRWVERPLPSHRSLPFLSRPPLNPFPAVAGLLTLLAAAAIAGGVGGWAASRAAAAAPANAASAAAADATVAVQLGFVGDLGVSNATAIRCELAIVAGVPVQAVVLASFIDDADVETAILPEDALNAGVCAAAARRLQGAAAPARALKLSAKSIMAKLKTTAAAASALAAAVVANFKSLPVIGAVVAALGDASPSGSRSRTPSGTPSSTLSATPSATPSPPSASASGGPPPPPPIVGYRNARGTFGLKPNSNPTTQGLCMHLGMLYIGGSFDYLSDDSLGLFNNIASWTGSKWAPLPCGASFGVTGGRVLALTVFQGKLYLAGSFSELGNGTAAKKIVAFEPASATWYTLQGGLGGTVNSLAVYNGLLYVVRSLARKAARARPAATS